MVLNRRFKNVPAAPNEARWHTALPTKLADIIFRISGHLRGLFRRYVFLFFYEYLVHTCSIAISRLVWKSYTQLSQSSFSFISLRRISGLPAPPLSFIAFPIRYCNAACLPPLYSRTAFSSFPITI